MRSWTYRTPKTMWNSRPRSRPRSQMWPIIAMNGATPVEVEDRLVLEGEADQVRLRILRRNVENFLHDRGVFPRPELHGRLLDHGFLRHRGLRWGGPAHHCNAWTLQPDLNIVLRLTEVRF